MMSDDELALREIIDGFREPIAEKERLVDRLLGLKRERLHEYPRRGGKALPGRDALNTIVEILKKIDELCGLFSLLYTHKPSQGKRFTGMLGDIKTHLQQEAFGVIAEQPTKAKLQMAGLIILLVCCKEEGIGYSYAERSKFYRLARWLLDMKDPKKAILKIKPYLSIAEKGWTISLKK